MKNSFLLSILIEMLHEGELTKGPSDTNSTVKLMAYLKVEFGQS